MSNGFSQEDEKFFGDGFESFHPELLKVRAKFTEAITFQRLTWGIFNSGFNYINDVFFERDLLRKFLKEKEMEADFLQYANNPNGLSD
ncbi:hypothetical protein CH368_06130 [Leptospira levettii]|nr:hypothetical protein CH368_06130 [Leptospira levettii]